MADRAYSDESLTPDEEAELRRAEANADLPPPEDGEQRPPADDTAPAPADPPAPAEPKPEDDKPTEDKAPPEPTDEEAFKAFLEKHKDKSPEELLRLAHDQSKRANAEAFQRRQTGDTLKTLQARVADAVKRGADRRAEIARKREDFDKRLKLDPDSATKEVFERQLADEEAAIEADEQGARIDAAVGLAREAFPEFDQVAPYTRNFATTLYSPEEVDAIDDGRHLIVLELARRFAQGYRQGLWSLDGRPLIETKAVDDSDPRLAKPDTVSTLSSAPARSGSGGKTPAQLAAEVARMSEAEFAKFSATPEFEDLMRNLE